MPLLFELPVDGFLCKRQNWIAMMMVKAGMDFRNLSPKDPIHQKDFPEVTLKSESLCALWRCFISVRVKVGFLTGSNLITGASQSTHLFYFFSSFFSH